MRCHRQTPQDVPEFFLQSFGPGIAILKDLLPHEAEKLRGLLGKAGARVE